MFESPFFSLATRKDPGGGFDTHLRPTYIRRTSPAGTRTLPASHPALCSFVPAAISTHSGPLHWQDTPCPLKHATAHCSQRPASKIGQWRISFHVQICGMYITSLAMRLARSSRPSSGKDSTAPASPSLLATIVPAPLASAIILGWCEAELCGCEARSESTC